jgi:hypothetical protein
MVSYESGRRHCISGKLGSGSTTAILAALHPSCKPVADRGNLILHAGKSRGRDASHPTQDSRGLRKLLDACHSLPERFIVLQTVELFHCCKMAESF